MNFGCGIGDILVVSKLAVDVYRACKRSGKEFQNISSEVSNLRIILEDLEEDLKHDQTAFSANRQKNLGELLKNANSVLLDLQAELDNYASLSTITQKKYDAVRFGFKDIADIRLRIITATTSLNAFENSLTRHSHTIIKKILLKYAKEVNMDLHDGSILTNNTAESLNTKEAWRDLRKELEDLGLSGSVLREKKEFIMETLQTALNESVADEEDDVLGDAGWSRRESTVTLVEEMFSEKVARRKSSVSKDADLSKLSSIDGRHASKKHSKLTSSILRLMGLVSDERLIEAADENDMHTTLKLINRGANVRASDKWRWTALHMAAYGGYDEIAKVLIQNGTLLDSRTVDGETPLRLAEKNGHHGIVQIIMEELDRLKAEEEEEKKAQGIQETENELAPKDVDEM